MNDQKRLEILGLLEQDARLTPENIAPMVGETVADVTAAITEMQEQGIILRYSAVINWEKAGMDAVTAVIDVKMTPQRDYGFDRLAERIARFPEVRSCYLMSGTYDLLVEMEAKNLKEVSRFVYEKLSALDGVHSTTTHFIMKRYKHDGVRFSGHEPDERLVVTP